MPTPFGSLHPARLAFRVRREARCRGRLKLILRGKRFGFSLEEIRQLLDLYHVGDQQQTQLERTYELASERLRALEAERDEMDRNIADLREQLKWGEKMLASIQSSSKAAAQ